MSEANWDSEAFRKGRNWFHRWSALNENMGQSWKAEDITKHAGFVADTPLVVPQDCPDKAGYAQFFVKGAVDAWEDSQMNPSPSNN